MKPDLLPILTLLHGAPASTLATHSLQMPGYPYATVVPNVLDEHHRPILLISALAEHTRNLLANPRVSLSITETGCANVQEGQRLTLLGDAERFEPCSGLVDRYLRYVPAAEQYLQLDFMFFRIHPRRLRYIGGVGKMGWVELDTFESARHLSLTDEALRLAEVAGFTPGDVLLLGLDPYGVDFAVHGVRRRLVLDGDRCMDEWLSTVTRLC